MCNDLSLARAEKKNPGESTPREQAGWAEKTRRCGAFCDVDHFRVAKWQQKDSKTNHLFWAIADVIRHLDVTEMQTNIVRRAMYLPHPIHLTFSSERSV